MSAERSGPEGSKVQKTKNEWKPAGVRVGTVRVLGRMRAPGDVSRVAGLPDDAVWMTEQCRTIEGMMKWSGGCEVSTA